MLISRAIPALYGGVSQQPSTQRSPIQLEEMFNSWATIVDGIGKRPPSEHIAKLSSSLYESAAIHAINRDSAERYEVIVVDGDLFVYEQATGAVKTVTFPSGKSYLDVPSGSTAADTFALVTVADYTFVVNKSIAVAWDDIGVDQVAQPGTYWDPNRGVGSGGAVQYQYPPNYADGSLVGAVQTFQDLPSSASEGATYLVRATVESGFVGYYVRRTSGLWVEVPKPGIANAMDALTLPHALVRLGDGTFEFGPFSWAPRRVGDTTSNPGPSFVGRKINDVFFCKNRLGFTVDENTVLSRAGDFGNFFRMSAIDTFDDDVVDVAATETQVTKMKYAVPMAEDIMLFSDQVQFRLNTGEVLTPDSCSLDVTTHYPMADARPAPLGSDIYFGSEEGGWVRLIEYFVRDDSNNTDGADVTGHVPRYIPKGLRQIVPTSEHDAVFLLTSGAESRIYHYKFYWANAEEKAQSAWGYWEFSPDVKVLRGAMLGEYLVLVLQRADGTYLERISLSALATAPGLDFEVYLDRRTEITGTYLSSTLGTEFVLPYPLTGDRRNDLRLVRSGDWEYGYGGLIDPSRYTWVDDTHVRAPGDLTEGSVFAGVSYEQRWTLSKFHMKDRNGDPDLTGRLQLRRVTVYYSRAGYFRIEAAPYGAAMDVELAGEFTGKTLGNSALLIGKPSFEEGSYSFQVYGDATQASVSVVNDTHLGAWFTSAEAELFWQKRARFG